VIKRNSYKPLKKSKILFLTLSITVVILLLTTINIKTLVKSELQGAQKHFVSFSTLFQLFDNGIKRNESLTSKDVIIGVRQAFFVFYDGLFSNKNEKLSNIYIFIKFKHLRKIYDDRERAITSGINDINPKKVPCKISDGVQELNCKVRLKGFLGDHWNEKSRISLRVEIKDGFINGLQNFSIQKARARQFPYNQVFHRINSGIGGLSSNDERFVNLKLNNENWGVMNIEPIPDNKFIEALSIKRSGVFRISNKDKWSYPELEGSYFISDPTLYFTQRGKESKILKNKNSREIYSYIFHNLNSKNPKLFNRNKMIDSLIISYIWGSLHSITTSNSNYTWNSYTKKLEPVLTDQTYWSDITKSNSLTYYRKLGVPYLYKNIFKERPITEAEYLSSLKKIRSYIKLNDPIIIANSLKKIFPNDRLFELSPIKNNLDFLEKKSTDVIFYINKISKEKKEAVFANTKNLEFKKKHKNIKDFIKVIHFLDGKIHIYNLLDQPVFISGMILDKKNIKINKEIPGSKNTFINKIEVTTNLFGIYDNKIKVKSNVDNVHKISKNDFSLMNLEYFENDRYYNEDTVCEKKMPSNICFISGKHLFTETIIFKKKVIIREGAELILSKNNDLIFESSVNMNGSKLYPILISGNDSGVIILNENESLSTINYVNFINLSYPSMALMKFTGGVNGYGGTFQIENSIFKNGNVEDQLNIVNANVDVANLFFKNAKSDAFDCDFCKGKMVNLNFDIIGGDALDLSGSDLKIDTINAYKIHDKAISAGELTNLNLYNVYIEKSGTGVAVKDGSDVRINKIKLNNIIYDDFMTYVKKPYFEGMTKLEVNELQQMDKIKTQKCIREKETFISINGKECKISVVDINKLYNEGRMKK
jgi:hypothetical protein